MAAPEARGQGLRTFIHVNTDTGSDQTGDGSITAPFKSVNKALDVAWDIRYDPPPNACVDPPIDTGIEVVIKVNAAVLPVAPTGFGGAEPADGWRSFKDECLMLFPKAFPIRMIERVSIEGVRSSGIKPRVLIDENGGSNDFTAADWGNVAIPRRAFFHGVSTATLSNFFLDGTVYFTKNTDRVVGVFAENTSAFAVQDCRVEDLYDGLRFHADGPLDATFASVSDCELISLGPITFATPDNEDQGHAGVWLKGAGSVDVSFSNTDITGCHDAIEVAGSAMTSGRVTIMNDCNFFGNENGIEAVGTGSLVMIVDECTFDSNVNLPFGMPLFEAGVPNSPGAIAARGMQNTVHVRGSTFFNNAFGLLTNAPGTYYFGGDGSGPGENTFDFSLPPGDDPTNAVRVAMYVKDPAADVTAAKNTWYHLNLNQGTDANGCLTGLKTGHPTNGENLVPSPMIPTMNAPPGPTKGQCCDPATGGDWKRNYSLEPNASIHFGSSCLP